MATASKLYRLLSGSITRYEGAEGEGGARKVVTYEANGERAGNLVWLTDREVQGVNRKIHDGQLDPIPRYLKRVEEVQGDVVGAPPQPQEEIVVADVTSLATGGAVGGSGNPAVERVLAKKAAAAESK